MGDFTRPEVEALLTQHTAEAGWWPESGGKPHYSYLPGTLRAVAEPCRDHCEVVARTALGDQAAYPFLSTGPEHSDRLPPSSVGMRVLARLRDLARTLGGRRSA